MLGGLTNRGTCGHFICSFPKMRLRINPSLWHPQLLKFICQSIPYVFQNSVNSFCHRFLGSSYASVGLLCAFCSPRFFLLRQLGVTKLLTSWVLAQLCASRNRQSIIMYSEIPMGLNSFKQYKIIYLNSCETLLILKIMSAGNGNVWYTLSRNCSSYNSPGRRAKLHGKNRLMDTKA